jgi:hypothetical protein
VHFSLNKKRKRNILNILHILYLVCEKQEAYTEGIGDQVVSMITGHRGAGGGVVGIEKIQNKTAK